MTEIPLNISRFFNETKALKTIGVLPAFVFLMYLWTKNRIVCYFNEVCMAMYKIFWTLDHLDAIRLNLLILIFVLLFMNAYWDYEMIFMLYDKVTGKKIIA